MRSIHEHRFPLALVWKPATEFTRIRGQAVHSHMSARFPATRASCFVIADSTAHRGVMHAEVLANGFHSVPGYRVSTFTMNSPTPNTFSYPRLTARPHLTSGITYATLRPLTELMQSSGT